MSALKKMKQSKSKDPFKRMVKLLEEYDKGVPPKDSRYQDSGE